MFISSWVADVDVGCSEPELLLVAVLWWLPTGTTVKTACTGT